MQALIAAAARRRQIRLAFACWEYMDTARLEKNTYHYNAMISVAEKSKNLRHALDLLREMDQRGIPKNEVTYVFLSSLVSSTCRNRCDIRNEELTDFPFCVCTQVFKCYFRQ
jgi:pentatricopeptide repeat protein